MRRTVAYAAAQYEAWPAANVLPRPTLYAVSQPFQGSDVIEVVAGATRKPAASEALQDALLGVDWLRGQLGQRRSRRMKGKRVQPSAKPAAPDRNGGYRHAVWTRRGRRSCISAPETRLPSEVPGVGGTGLEPVTPSLSSWCSPN